MHGSRPERICPKVITDDPPKKNVKGQRRIRIQIVTVHNESVGFTARFLLNKTTSAIARPYVVSDVTEKRGVERCSGAEITHGEGGGV